MKRSLTAVALSIACLFACLNITAFGDSSYDDFEYTIADGTATITAYKGDGGYVDVPDMIEGATVGAIGDFAFYGSKVEVVTLPETVTSIGESAFFRCRSLESVNIPDGVTSIGVGVFCSCSSLKAIDIPSSVTYIEPGVFYDCGALDSITVADNNPSYVVEDGVLYSKDMTTLMYYPMSDCRFEFDIPDSVTHIAEYACYGAMFRVVDLPEGLNKIDAAAFYKAKNLITLTIPKNVDRLEDTTFSGCTMLQDVHFENPAIVIDTYAF